MVELTRFKVDKDSRLTESAIQAVGVANARADRK